METVTVPSKLPQTDTSLKAHNETNIANGYDANNQQCPIDCDIPMQKVPLIDERLRVTELAFETDITMAEPQNVPVHVLNGKHSQAHNNWTDNKENTKLTSDLDRLIQKNDAQLYDECGKQPVLIKAAAATVKVCEESDANSAARLNGSNGVCNGDDDIDMATENVIDEQNDDCEQATYDTHRRQTRARSESPKMCENQRVRKMRVRRQSQPESESNDVDDCDSQCDASPHMLHVPLKRGKSLSPPKIARRQQSVACARNAIHRYLSRPLSLLRRQKYLARARQARLSPSIGQQSAVKSPKMTTSKESTADRADKAESIEKANASDESEYSSLEDDDDALEPHDSDDDDFSDVDEATRNDNKALYNSSNGFTIDQSSANSIMLADSVPGQVPKTGPLAASLFPHVPPYLTFVAHDDKSVVMPPAIKKFLKWKLTTITPIVIRKIILNSGFRLLKQTDDWVGTWGKHMKSPCFRQLRSYQKMNHIPGTFQIGRKDRIWRNLQSKVQQFGQREFNFMPQTYILPQDGSRLKRLWPRFADRNTKWIIKPPASARGTGIKVVDKWKQIPKRKPIIVQKYVDRPLLIDGSKFDLRLYVLVTSVNPLRAYMHTDGLARFASVKYSNNADTLNDRFMHLTNYSINKLSSNYTKNEDAESCTGHKWTLKTLWKNFQAQGINTDGLWAALRNLILRTMLTGEHVINQMTKVNVNSKSNAFELFGIDVILDAELKPWLLEVNISPSLHSSSPLDLHVKSPLVTALLNTVMYQVPPKFNATQQAELMAELGLEGKHLCYDRRLHITHLSKGERLKHNEYTHKSIFDREQYLYSILDDLTPDDLRCLITAEDELARCAPLERICPTPNSHRYLKFTEHSRYYNRLLDAWETQYADKRDEGIRLLRSHCELKKHLLVTQAPKNRLCRPMPLTNEPACSDNEAGEVFDTCEPSASEQKCSGSNGMNGVAGANSEPCSSDEDVDTKECAPKDLGKKSKSEARPVEATVDQREVLVTSHA